MTIINIQTQRSTSSNTIKNIIQTLEAIEGITVVESPVKGDIFRTNLEIKLDKETTNDDLVALGALIGQMEANVYI